MLAVHRHDLARPVAQAPLHEIARDDQRLLVRQRDALSRFERRERRIEPRRADDRVEDDVHVVARRRRDERSRCRSSSASSPIVARFDHARRTHGENSARLLLAAARRCCCAVRAVTRNRSRWRSSTRSAVVPIDPVEPSTATPLGAAACITAGWAAAGGPSKRNAIGITNSRPSKRSSIPPCPGRMRELSFTPASRLSSDSARSPVCAATLTTIANRTAP